MPAMLVHPDSQMDEDATEDDDEMSWDEENEFAQGVFEVTHAWDGSVAFTNGFNDGQGLLDWAFEAEAAAAISSASSSSSPTPEPMQPPSPASTLDFLPWLWCWPAHSARDYRSPTFASLDLDLDPDKHELPTRTTISTFSTVQRAMHFAM